MKRKRESSVPFLHLKAMRANVSIRKPATNPDGKSEDETKDNGEKKSIDYDVLDGKDKLGQEAKAKLDAQFDDEMKRVIDEQLGTAHKKQPEPEQGN